MSKENIKQLISAYFDGETSVEESKLAEKYIAESDEYRQYYESLSSLSSTLNRWNDEDLSPDLEQKLQVRLEKRQNKEESKMEKKFTFSLMTAGTIAVAVLAVVVVQQLYGRARLQARVRDANQYLQQQTRMKMAADDIGEQFSVGNTSELSSLRSITGAESSGRRIELAKTEKSDLQPADFEFWGGGPAVDKAQEPKAANKVVGGKDALVKHNKGKYLNQEAQSLGTTKQYEPYYLTTDYDATRVTGQVGTLGEAKPSFGAGALAKQAPAAAPALPAARQPKIVSVASDAKRQRAAGGFQSFSYDASGLSDRDVSSTAGRNITVFEDDGVHYEQEVKPYIQIQRGDRPYDEEADYRYNQPVIYYPVPNSEEYAPVYDNAFSYTQYQPLSTFAVDVDTASYSNVRRYLNQSQLPPVDAVRIEEMINYFSYSYPQPTWGKPFSITTEVGKAPWNPSHDLVLVGIQGKTLSQREVPPSHLTFLIDVSGSMQAHNKLPLLKQGLKMMVNELDRNDRVSIVTYAGSARTVIESVPGDQKWRINSAIDSLYASGSTYGESGIHLAYNIANKHMIRRGNNRVILATDGDFNVGISDEHGLVNLIKHKRDRGVFLTVLGFGTGNIKDAKMEKLANNGNGNYAYIDTAAEAEKVLVNELGTNLFTIAKDVKIQVEFNPTHVSAYRLIGYENRALSPRDFSNDRVDAGEVGAGHSITALYEVVPTHVQYPSVDRGTGRLRYQKNVKQRYGHEMMTVKLRYKEPKGRHSKLMSKIVKRDHVWFKRSSSKNFKLATGLAEFGLLLRNSAYKGYASYDNAMNQVREGMYPIRGDNEEELIRLIGIARQIDHRNPAMPVPMPAPVYQPLPIEEYHQPAPQKQFKGQ